MATARAQWMNNQLDTKHFLMAQAYGTHLPMQIRMECETVAQSRRLPGMTNCNIAMETLLGRDETIEFEDYLGLAENSTEGVDMRAMLEKKYGLQPRNNLGGRIGGPQTSELPSTKVACAKELGSL